MVSLEEIQAAYYMVAVTGVLVAAAYYVMTLRTTQRNLRANLETRQAQLFMDIYKTYSSKEYQKDREQMQLLWEFEGVQDFVQKYGARANPDEHAKWDTQVAQFVGIGTLARMGLIKPDLVFDLIYDSVIVFYEKFQPVIQELRKYYIANFAQDAEYLYNEMKRIANERGLPIPDKDRNLMYKLESEAPPSSHTKTKMHKPTPHKT